MHEAGSPALVHLEPFRMQRESLEQVLARHRDNLMSFNGVVGTAMGSWNDEPCILVMVIKLSQDSQRFPEVIEGYPVHIQETGEISAVDD